MFRAVISAAATGAILAAGIEARVAHEHQGDEGCRQTTVAILGGGMAGIAAAQALHNDSVSDFVIIEYQNRIGGRLMATEFGQQEDGSPYTLELGANWVHGIDESPGATENPIWTMAKKHKLQTYFSDYDSLITYDETGESDYIDVLDEFYEASEQMSVEAGRLLVENIQDRTGRSGLALAGWNPKLSDMHAHAAEVWGWDWEGTFPPEQSSMIFGSASENLTYAQYGEDNNLVIDPRGYSAIIHGEAASFLSEDDDRLMLNTKVTNISYTDHGVTVHNEDGSCVSAAYAICTFSLGVLQNDVVAFEPELPDWKRTAIYQYDMGTYTKIFFQFNETFWPEKTEYFLYASPLERGHWAVWQSLTPEPFFPGSNIIFATMLDDQSARIERLSDDEVKEEGMRVLRQMFPEKNVPEPVAFTFPRWDSTEWAYGSYSNWPAGTTLEMHQNLRANVDRLWFAGEATSTEYFGYLHGAWFEGRASGMQIAGLLQNRCVEVYPDTKQCGTRVYYDELKGTSPLEHYTVLNGWAVNSWELAEKKKRDLSR